MSVTPGQTQAESKPVRPSRHIPALDGIRGIAILLVLFLHLTVFTHGDPVGAAQKGLGTLARFGVMGVDLFFVLSGYLITGILYDAKGHGNYFRNFYARRTVRVFPLYYVIMALVLVVLPLLPGWFQIYGGKSWGDWWYWLYLSNYVPFAGHDPGQHKILVVTWSLAIEEQFYLLWPLVCFMFGRRGLLWVSGVLIVASPVLRTVLVAAGMPWEGVGGALPCRMDSLAVGAVCVLMTRGPGGRDVLVGLSRWLFPGGLLALVALVVGQKVVLHWNGGFMQGPLYQTAGFTVVAVMFGALITLAVAAKPGSVMGHVANSRILATFGRYSYGLYLLHMPVILMITEKLYGPATATSHPLVAMPMGKLSGLAGQAVLYAIGLVALLAVAMASWHGMEKHFLRLKDLFPMDKESGQKARRSDRATIGA